MAFNNKHVQVNAYIFSTDQVVSSDPQYSGTKGHIGNPISWTHLLTITENCGASVIKVKEKDPDSTAEVSSTLTAKEPVLSAHKSKRIVLMEL